MENTEADILVVDDDPTVRDVITRYLRRAGFGVVPCPDGRSALAALAVRRPRLVILDLMLPDIDGIEVCRRVRAGGPGGPGGFGDAATGSDVPIIMLTALGEEEDRVLGLETGADDYVTKPFSPRELVLRVTSVLRRSGANGTSIDVDGTTEPGGAASAGLASAGLAPAGLASQDSASPHPPPLVDGDLTVDTTARTATLAGRAIAVTVREFDLLAFLVANPGRVFSRAELLERVWGWTFGDQSTVTVHIRRLREKVEANPTKPSRIATVWGVGYRYDPVSATETASAGRSR